MSEPVWLDGRLLRRVHGMMLREHGGAEGVRDDGLLEAALARPRQHYVYAEPAPDLCELAALYAAGLVRNHPFVDGNKRAGFMAAYVFLARNGLELQADEAEATQMVRALAASEIDARVFAEWLRRETAAG
jgi:death-on-curing protein